MQAFLTPLSGGLLIGSAAVLLMLLVGRIAGISGILWSALSRQAESSWRWLFLLGLLAGAWLYHSLSGAPFPTASSLPWPQALIGGLLVGVGVKTGNGCTSGHGVCGIGLLSRRSVLATLTFMATGIITVFLLRHVLESAL